MKINKENKGFEFAGDLVMGCEYETVPAAGQWQLSVCASFSACLSVCVDNGFSENASPLEMAKSDKWQKSTALPGPPVHLVPVPYIRATRDHVAASLFTFLPNHNIIPSRSTDTDIQVALCSLRMEP